jgi:fatty-acyl-CoA synthase
VPRYVKFVNEFPMTVTGKIQKFVMREISIRELQLEEEAGIETA